MAVEKITAGEINNFQKNEEKKYNALVASQYLQRRAYGFEDELLNVNNYNIAYYNFGDGVGINGSAQLRQEAEAQKLQEKTVEQLQEEFNELKAQLKRNIAKQKELKTKLANAPKTLDAKTPVSISGELKKQLEVSEANTKLILTLPEFGEVYKDEVQEQKKDVNTVVENYQKKICKFLSGGAQFLGMTNEQLAEHINAQKTTKTNK